ncbi:MAG: hypothetical protein HY519_04425 [Candidatus Aenigmarchaeota archaeon]|nr:hypothetical protein [Candidatus Aenigmarchaeota archaeon]
MKFALAILLLALALANSAAALQIKEIKVIPSNLSANASFIAYAKLDTSQPARVAWVAPHDGPIGDYVFGALPKSGDAYSCFFTADGSGNCGASPFFEAKANEFVVSAIDSNMATDRKNITIRTGPLAVTIQSLRQNASTNTLSVLATVSLPPADMGYELYGKDFAKLASGRLELNAVTSFYEASFSLPAAAEYLGIIASSGAGSGGTLIQLSTASANVTPAGPASGAVRADSVNIPDAVLRLGGEYSRGNFELYNSEGNVTHSGLRVVVPAGLAPYLSVELQKDRLAPQERAFFTVRLRNVTGNMSIATTADILANTTAVGRISIAIDASVLRDRAIAGSLDVEPQAWSEELLASKETTASFRVTNPSDSAVGNLTVAISSGLRSILTANGSKSIAPKGTGRIDLTALAAQPGEYFGTVTITSEAGSGMVFVSLAAAKDISAEIEQAATNLAALDAALPSQYLSAARSAKANIDQARNNYLSGRYRDAAASLAAAKAATAVLESVDAGPGEAPKANDSDGGPSAGGDGNLIIIVFLIVAAGLGALFLVRRMRKKGQEMEEGMEDY